MKSILMTQEGFEKIQEEQKKLLSERPAAVEDLKKAREMGDLSENGYYKGARAKLSSIDARLRYLTHVIRFAKVKDPTSSGVIDIGSRVILQGENGDVTYMIVGEHEANPSEKKISHVSPLGQALMGKKTGEEAHIQTPRGKMTYKITSIS